MNLLLDIECTWTKPAGAKRENPSPYLSTNSLVSVGYIFFNDEGVLSKDYLIFNHTTCNKGCQAENFKKLQEVINKSKLIIGHNLKFDMSWLYECGFKYHGSMYDTMIAEYVFSKGLKQPINLDASCARYGLEAKLDILETYRHQGVNTDAVPLNELIEYGEQDIIITKQLYEKQQSLMALSPDHAYMKKAVSLMNDMLPVIIDMERNGIHIDLKELDRVEKLYKDEYITLEKELNKIVVEVMGHTPINLESPEHLSWILYSRKVKDKVKWKEIFNLGSEIRNSVSKVKYSKRMSLNEFRQTYNAHTDKLYKTEAKQCEVCNGAGRIRKTKADGNPFKNESACKACEGCGFNYISTGVFAGFKLSPLGSDYTSVGGFSTDKVTILELLQKTDLPDKAKQFLNMFLRINSISTYLNTFVDGIRRNVHENILHCSFNQCITATGRLSSSNPNFQNLPRGKTFPVRKVITSRFEGGKILSVDFKQLEFRVAAILAKDEQAKADILNSVDIHAFTRDTITAAGQPMDRQDAKIRTFKPLYGGIKGTPAEEAYYRSFLLKYKGIDAWQHALEDEALNTRQIKSPSGRIYAFPNVRRLPNGNILGHTQIKNYIVQGFATGDISPIAMINIFEMMQHFNMKSKIILAVHDDVTADVHPDEIEQMIKIFKAVFKEMNNLIYQRFGVKTDIPIEGEFSLGNNWLEKKEIAA